MKTEDSRRDFIRRGLLGALAGGCLSGGLPECSISAAEPAAAGTPWADRRKLGRIGAEVSILGLGLGGAFMRAHGEDREAGHRLLESALGMGINYWDTARSYGPSESMIAPVLVRNRARVFLASKTDARDYDGFKRDLEQSLKVLQTDNIELFQIHDLRPRDQAKLDLMEKGAVRAAREAREQKTIRAFGITGHSGAAILIECMRRFDPDAVLTIFPATRPDRGRYEDELLPLARERNTGVIAMKTIRYGRDADLPARELLRYALSLDGVCTAIVGLDTLAHLKENVEVAANFRPASSARRASLTNAACQALAGYPPPWEREGYQDGACV